MFRSHVQLLPQLKQHIKFSISTIIFLGCLPIFARSMDSYFQQQLKYYIQVELQTALNRLECQELITYQNNSSDTLRYLYFHLYLNRYKHTNLKPSSSVGYQEVIFIRDESNNELDFQVSGTLLKLSLLHPIAPHDSTRLFIRFNAVLPSASERFGFYGNHYDVGNWYPTPVVYNKDGWQTSQHIEGEFFQEWADFRVDITVPAGYLVGATGTLINTDILPDSLEYPERKKTYYKNEDSLVTFQFVAPRVHDFAWSADPEFILRKTVIDSTTVWFFIQSYRLKEWEAQIEKTGKAFKFLVEHIGPYPYPNLTVIDGYVTAGGIEYPNLVIINDLIDDSLELSATIIHEISHQWFYGILANNQTRFGWMDEGFATFFEREAMKHVYGEKKIYVESPAGFWGKWFGYWETPEYSDLYVYLRYVRRMKQEPINRHFDWFQGDPFIPYYQKMSLVIEQLRLLGGDSLFWKGIAHYYDTWKFRHPDPQDLFSAFETIYQQKLDWFFEEWLNTTWTCDYAVKHISGQWIFNETAFYQAQIHFQRKKPIVMPLDFRVYFKNGTYQDFRIPVDDGTNFLPTNNYVITPWVFYEKEKIVRLRLPEQIKKVKINPTKQLLDINPFNDDSRCLKFYIYWLKRQYYRPHIDGYTITLLPFVFYNELDGLQIGIRTRGNFISPDLQHRLHVYLGLLSFKPDVDFWFEHPLYSIHPEIHLKTNLYNGSGQRGIAVWIQRKLEKKGPIKNFIAGYQWRHMYDADYVPYPLSLGNLSYFEMAYEQGWWEQGYLPSGWQFQLHSETSFPGSDYLYHQWDASGKVRFPILFHQKMTFSFFSGHQTGGVPLQKAFRLGGADLYSFYQNPYLRSAGIIPLKWWQKGHIFQPGGGNLSSLSYDYQPFASLLNGYLSITLGNPIHLTYSYIPYLSDLLISAYSSWSTVANRWGNFTRFYGEAGFSVTFSRLPFLFNYFDLEQLHVDFPFWVNEEISRNNLQLRWTIRIDMRSFY